MIVASAVSLLEQPVVVARRRLVHRALLAVSVISALVALTRALPAQTADPQPSKWELRFTSGALVPVGEQRNALDDAQMSAAQVSWVVRPSFAITGTFGWARSRDLGSAESHRLDVFSSDLGAELRGSEMRADRRMTFTPFAGAGAGARSYNYRKLDIDATTNLAAYATVGGEIGAGKVGIRLEVRDYTSGFRPIQGVGTSDVRNDVVFMVGVRFDRQRVARD